MKSPHVYRIIYGTPVSTPVRYTSEVHPGTGPAYKRPTPRKTSFKASNSAAVASTKGKRVEPTLTPNRFRAAFTIIGLVVKKKVLKKSNR